MMKLYCCEFDKLFLSMNIKLTDEEIKDYGILKSFFQHSSVSRFVIVAIFLKAVLLVNILVSLQKNVSVAGSKNAGG